MDLLNLEYYGLLALVSYGIGYFHANTVKRSVKKSLEDWMSESVANAANFGLIIINEVRNSGEEITAEDEILRFEVDIDGRIASVVIFEITK